MSSFEEDLEQLVGKNKVKKVVELFNQTVAAEQLRLQRHTTEVYEEAIETQHNDFQELFKLLKSTIKKIK